MSIRPATSADHHAEIPWLRADNPDQDQHCFVEEVADAIVAAALRTSNPIHPGLDNLHLTVTGPATTALLRAITSRSTSPCLLRGLPGTAEYALAMAAGAAVFERVPAAFIDPSDPEIIAWASAHAGATVPASEVSTEELTELWIAYYRAAHAHFGTTRDREVLVKHLGGFVRRAVDAKRTRLVIKDGRPVAAAFVFHVDGQAMALADALPPEHSQARRAVEIAMSALIMRLNGPIELDGHASGDHYPTVLASIPGVRPGKLTPMELLRLEPRPGRGTR